MPRYAYRGHAGFASGIEGRLAEAGFVREGEVEVADFVITYCTTMTALEDLYFGDDGLVQLMRPGTVAIDMSPCTPNFASEVNAVATIHDIVMVEAPLVVKNKVAEDVFKRVNLSCFAGSEGDGVAKAKDVLDAVFGDVQEVEDAGSAQLARAASTIQNTAEIVSAIETLSLFKSCSQSVSGFDVRGVVPEATSPEAYFIMNAVKGERFEGAYTVEMLLAELSAAMMTADDYELILPQTEAAFHLYELLAIIGGSDLSPAALALVYEGEGADEDAHGLDWSRVEGLYGEDPAGLSLDDFDMQGLDDYDCDCDEDDDLTEGFGYSVN